MKKPLYIKATESTNNLMKDYCKNGNCEHGFAIYTDYQTKGKGQSGNTWESENEKNLLFSLIIYPNQIPIERQFIISQIISLSIIDVLKQYANDFSVKWPNDIYWKDKKIGGILIENSIQGNSIKHSIIGVGLNINQREFPTHLPNPVSLYQIIGNEVSRKEILDHILSAFLIALDTINLADLKQKYLKNLFRIEGTHPYKTENKEEFIAKILDVETDGLLILETTNKEKKAFYFKEVQFIL